MEIFNVPDDSRIGRRHSYGHLAYHQGHWVDYSSRSYFMTTRYFKNRWAFKAKMQGKADTCRTCVYGDKARMPNAERLYFGAGDLVKCPKRKTPIYRIKKNKLKRIRIQDLAVYDESCVCQGHINIEQCYKSLMNIKIP